MANGTRTQQAGAPALRNVLHCLFKRKGAVIAFFLLCIAGSALFTSLMKPTYEATAQILVKLGRENVFIPASGIISPVVNIRDREEQINTEVEILKSRTLVQQVVEKLGAGNIYNDLRTTQRPNAGYPVEEGAPESLLTNLAVLRLQRSLEVRQIQKSNVIEIRFRHHDSSMAAKVLNTLTDLFLDRHLEVHKSPRVHSFFREQTQVFKRRLEEAQKALEQFKERHRVSAFAEQQRLLLNREAELKSALQQVEAQVADIQKRLPKLRDQLASTPRFILEGEEAEHNPYILNSLMDRLVNLQARERELLAKYNEKSRLVKETRKEIAFIKGQLAEQEKKLFKRKRYGPNPLYTRLREDLLRNEGDLTGLLARKEILDRQLDQVQKRLHELSRVQVKLENLQNKLQLNRQNYQLYLGRFEESRISEAMDTERIANVSVIESAKPPMKPISPRVRLNLLLGAFLGLFGGMLMAFVLEYLDDTVERPEEVEAFLQIPVLASIPDLRRR